MSRHTSKVAAPTYIEKFEQANKLLTSGMYIEAEEIYCSLVVESFGRDASLLCKLGDLYYKKNNFDLAIKIFDTAISINPKFPWGYICKAEVCEEIGKYSEAQNYLNFVEKNFSGYDFVKERLKALNDLMVDVIEPAPKIFTLPKNCVSEGKKSCLLSIAVIAWDITHNPVGRAWTLCEIANSFGEVCLQGPMFESFGRDLWEPLRSAPREFDIKSFITKDFSTLMNGAIEMVKQRKFDVVIVSKARFPSILIGILYKLIHNSKIILDVDDDELSFIDATSELTLDKFIASFESTQWEKSYGKGWTQFANSLIKYFDGITTCNEAFNKKLGGIILRHARDKKLLRSKLQPSAEEIRIKLGFKKSDWIILFLGTARKYKGLETLVQAIQISANPDIVLVIAGHIDDDLKKSLDDNRGIRIIYYPTWPFEDMVDLYSIANCISLIQDPKSISANWQTPAKISDALIFSVPIIATSTLGIAELAERGIVIPTNPDAYSVSQSIQCLNKKSKKEIIEIKKFLSDIFQKEFSLEANASILERYIGEITNFNHKELNEIVTKLLKFIDQRMPGLLLNSWRENFGNSISARPINLLKEPVNPNADLNVVFFWKQNDSGIFDRRHDMLIHELSQNPAVKKILQIDAPICVDDVLKGLSLDSYNLAENNIVSENIILRYLKTLDNEKIVRRTFVYKGNETHMLGQELPSLREYPNYVEQWLERADMTNNTLAWVCPVVPEFDNVQQRIGFSFIVADLIDDQRQYKQKVSTLRKINKSYENIFKIANVAITNCRHNFQLMSEYGAKPHLVTNALSMNLAVDKWDKPDLLKKLVGPIIGYAGNMRDRFDWDLLKDIASTRPDWNLVLIGELPSPLVYKDLVSFSNVHFLGAMPAQLALQYIYYFDVGIIPHIKDKLSESMNPLKLYVYRGLGLDVVSTDVPNLDIVDSAVSVVTTDIFVDSIENALVRKLNNGRAYMSDADMTLHSWSARMSQIFELINKNLEESHVNNFTK